MVKKLLFFVLFFAIPFNVLAFENVGRARVIDGDTLEIDAHRIRLFGIDSPESKQQCWVNNQKWHCGKEATQLVISLVRNKEVSCQKVDTDRYKRSVSICSADGSDIAEKLVKNGLALAYRKYSRRYVPFEKEARANKVGMWKGDFTQPWEWRKGMRVNRLNDRSCYVKGNVNSKGNKIYHLRTGQHYHQVQIVAGEGDRCFSSEDNAMKAGFRKSKR